MSDHEQPDHALGAQVAQPPPGSAWGWNPISRRYVKRSGAVYKRLVMSGVIKDAEVAEQLEGPPRPARERRNNVRIAGVEDEPTAADVRDKAKETAQARRTAKKLIARHVDRLEGLPPDQVEDIIRRLLAEKLSEGEAPAPAQAPPGTRVLAPAKRAPVRSSAVRVKLAPVAAPRRKASRVAVSDLFSTTEAESTAASDYSDDE